MFWKPTTVFLFGVATLCTAQDPDPVPTGSPIPGDYTGRYRPQIHFSPPQHYMNDPNGLFLDKSTGTWHLYYQYNPTGITPGNQHWGHATSSDLYHWQNQPIALFPPEDNVFIFTGSTVVDEENTSGFFPDQKNGVVAIYTLAGPNTQTQAIAYSRDGGYTFTPYENNPVIPSSSNQFRDPKVIRYQDQWVMVVAWAHELKIGIYTSYNLKEWTATTNFTVSNPVGGQWECPNMVRIPYQDDQGTWHDDTWLMFISFSPDAPLGGSISMYYPGTFNGTHFEPVDSTVRIADFGKDNFAGQFFYGTPESEPPVQIAWASNGDYAGDVPTADEGWRSTMTVPRQTYLAKLGDSDWKLVSRPYDLDPVRGSQLASTEDLASDQVNAVLSGVASNAVYWEIDVTGIPDSGAPPAATFNFTFSTSSSGETVDGFSQFSGDYPFTLNRGGAKGFDNQAFTSTNSFTANSPPKAGSWKMSGIMDRSVMEIFLNDGLESATSLFFTNEPLHKLVLSTSEFPDGMRATARVYELNSVWTATNKVKGRALRELRI
ncbi:Extracellular exo-inulinase inuE [Paramyrothecium foliicola]|nr:Extracellular exo-inulinase inuE [Paramyrothecium foliicola]